MGYANTQIAIQTYVPSDDVLINNAANKAGNSDDPVFNKIKEITLGSTIGSSSLFRFKFILSRSGGTARGRIYRNGSAIGTEQTVGGAPTEFTEDIVSTTWVESDTVELWVRITGAPSVTPYGSDFRICGIGSEWINTVV